MTYRIQGLGWLPDPPDVRDFRVTNQLVMKTTLANVEAMSMQGQAGVFRTRVEKLPPSADLRQLCSEIEDQESIGSCTAQSVCGLIEYLQRSLYGQQLDVSRLFLYKVTRTYLGWTGDTGAFVRSAIKALRLFGVPPEDYYPYAIARFDEEPAAFLYAFASNYRAIQYYRLNTLDDLKESLAKGIPFAFGFSCYKSMFTDEVRRTGNIPLPTATDRIVGGHAVMAVGYDENTGRLLIRNSWGTGWGDAGYGTLPYEYVTQNLAQDFWVLGRADVVPEETR